MPPLPLVRAVERFRAGLVFLHRKLVPSEIAVLEMMTAGWLAQAIAAAAELGIADELAKGPRSAADLATAVGADEDALRRLLRLLISHGLFAEDRDGRYRLNKTAEVLRADSPVTLRDMTLFVGSKLHRERWSQLTDAVRTGRPIASGGAEFFELAQTDREVGEMFNKAMASVNSIGRQALLAAYDFSRYGVIVDVGGGTGMMLTEILRHTPGARGVLFDLPQVVADVPARLAEAGLAQRCEVVGGSFFESVPEGGDAYILQHIVHDWPEADIARILGAVRAAMKPHSRLLLFEIVLPEHDRPHPAKYIDLEMLVNVGGRERTVAEYRDLLARNGFALEQVVPTVSPENILVARPADG